MNVLLVYARLYGECLAKAVNGLKKNAWTLLLPAGLLVAWILSAGLAAPLGFVGGILRQLFMAALTSCYLYFIGEIVAHSRVSVAEIGRSIGAYFWSTVNLFFVIWVAEMIPGFLRINLPANLMLALKLIALILLSAAPEAIYQRGTYGGLATIQRSISFLQEHWIEWLLPSAILLAALWWMPEIYGFGLSGLLINAAVKGATFHLGMVFRGHLFAALDGSTHRQRMFKYRSARAAGG
ncbi:MAG TPA: hypothetical protein VEM39_03030 [Myxococcaceae bacterium]|nr:hypothetical protein [Myxococcaceae bacterium]